MECNCIKVGEKPAYVWSLNHPKDGFPKSGDSLHRAIVSNVTDDMWLVDLGEAGIVQNVIMHKPPYARQINGDKTVTVGRWITLEAYLQLPDPK